MESGLRRPRLPETAGAVRHARNGEDRGYGIGTETSQIVAAPFPVPNGSIRKLCNRQGSHTTLCGISVAWSERSGDPSLFVLVGTMTGTAQEPSKTANKGGVKRAIVHRRAGEGGDEMPQVGEQHVVNSPELGKKLVGKCGLSVKGGGDPQK